MGSSKDIISSATTLASYNVVLQLIFRLLTFCVNGFILRYITKDILGIVNVRLTLLYTTVLFIAREAFRKACLSKAKEQHWTQVINLLWCTIPIGLITASILAAIWIYLLEQPNSHEIPYYGVSVLAFAESAVVELLAEPLFVVGQLCLFVKTRVIIEGAALALRCLLSVTFILFFPEWGLLAFAISQICFTCFFSGAYYLYFIYYISRSQDDLPYNTFRDFFPKWKDNEPILSSELSTLTISFFKQGFLKQILTEGERYVMTLFDVLSFADQGVYDVINNLGSLAARFIFLPIEDSAYLVFSQTIERGKKAINQDKDHLELVSNVLECLLKIVTLIGLIILTFGYAYSYLLLDIYGGSIISKGTGPQLLQWFCIYVLLIAVNGVAEGFVFACMDSSQIDRYNRIMLVFSVLFLASSWFLTNQIGSIGFVLANCLNMIVRIAHSLYFMTRFYSASDYFPIMGIFPALPVVIVLALSFIITSYSEIFFIQREGLLPKIYHIAIGACCLCITMASIYFSESKLINFVKVQYHGRSKKID